MVKQPVDPLAKTRRYDRENLAAARIIAADPALNVGLMQHLGSDGGPEPAANRHGATISPRAGSMSTWTPPSLPERIDEAMRRAAEAQADRAAALAILASPYPYPLVSWARTVVEQGRVGPFLLARRITERAA